MALLGFLLATLLPKALCSYKAVTCGVRLSRTGLECFWFKSQGQRSDFTIGHLTCDNLIPQLP